MYAKPIEQLIRAFKRLPTVGERTAERFVFALLKSGRKDVAELTVALKGVIDNIQSCQMCWDFSDQSPCPICADEKRDHTMICIVSEPQDMHVIDDMKIFDGVYHILRGTLAPEKDPTGSQIKFGDLFERIKKNTDTKEVILALNPDMRGETTAMSIEEHIKSIRPDIKVSRLARGLPMGSDIQYADEITLESAFRHRTQNE